MPSYTSLFLSDLPLRPSTLTLLQQRGFVTLAELQESKASGLATLAAELQVDLPKVMRLLREIQDCLTAASAAVSPAENHTLVGPLTAQASEKNASDSLSSNSYNANTPNMDNVPQLLVTPPPPMTASDILSKASTEKGGIITFCRSLDQLLHRSGIPLGSLTEIAGLPGLGKTQFAMQLAVNARLPVLLGGVQGQTIYVDAEGSLAPERLETMAKALLQHCEHTLRKRGRELPSDFCEASQILEDVHVFRVLDEAAQTATLYSLPYWIQELSKASTTPVKLIVVDSIAFHYRSASTHKTDYQERNRSLTRLAAFLNDLARDYNVAVVCLNQMTTKLISSGGSNNRSGGQSSRLVPALGESWAHAVTTRLLLSSDYPQTDTTSTRRFCRLVKSPCMPAGTAYYQVTEVGVRDAPPPPPPTVAPAPNSGEENLPPRHDASTMLTTGGRNQYKRPRTN